ncbi:MAG: tyrosine--tRNA ligase [Phycisphaerales bacterium]|nr:tyrosine--tRNA ligase [Phycisphaerales bacterium]
MPQPDTTIDALLRGTAAVYTRDELAGRLAKASAAGRPLRVKLGLDPSSPDIHLGHTVVLGLMRRFQDLGHIAVLIIGDYTARIGDPTGKSKTRPMLTELEIDANAQTYLEQATRVLDADPSRLEVRRNSEWLSKLTFADTIRLASHMTVARMLERDTFDKRYKAGQPISVHEFLYPLMQGWDSVCIRADVELGGTDQTFNNLVGRDFQIANDQPPQIVITMPILRGLDGREKMSKSLGNYIGVTESADEMFGKTMSIPDDLMSEWFTLCTAVPADEIEALCDAQRTHPRQAKERLGREIVKRFHGPEAAQRAAQEFASRFREGNLPADLETHRLALESAGVLDLMREVGFAASNNEARRLVAQGGVSIDEQKVSDPTLTVPLKADGIILRVGKRRVCRIVRA